MVNRRSLRIKAMQALYAFHQCKASDYQLALDKIGQQLTPEAFDRLEGYDPRITEGKVKLAQLLFREHHLTEGKADLGEDGEVAKVAAEAIAGYHQQVKKDFDFFRRNMVSSVENIEKQYILLLLLLVEFAEQVNRDREDEKLPAAEKPRKNLLENPFIKAISQSPALMKKATRETINWVNHKQEIKDWYAQVVKKDETMLAYLAKPSTGFEEDKEAITYLFRNIILKDEAIQAFLERAHLGWAEDKPILKSMVTKTLNSVSEAGQADIELLEISENWEEDKEFFSTLFANTVKHNEEYENLISGKTHNWDIERIAFTDRILLKMAVAEMISFPSIPVKVTINEYIEISKLYSTPKSRKFINGLLDKVAAELTEKGLIKKSGRGLIDNK